MSQPSQMSTPGLASGVPLPKGVISIRQIHGMKEIPPFSIVTVIGVVKDYRQPCPTRKVDYKATLTVYDLSTEDGDDLQLHLFKPLEQMPPDMDGGDIVCIRQAKVQKFTDDRMSLLSNHATRVHVFKHKQMSTYPEPAIQVPSVAGKLPVEFCKYVSFLNGTITKECIPDDSVFQAKKKASLNIKEKFRELKDVRDHTFVDLVAQVVRRPFDSNFERMSLWVTDYTENDGFYSFANNSGSHGQIIHGDAMGYTSIFESSQRWQGPWGKRCLQITCFDRQADWVRDNVKEHQWLLLRNVHIKLGRNGACLEGFLREDRAGPRSPVTVSLLQLPGDSSENMDPRVKEGLRRKRAYQLAMKNDMKALEALSTKAQDVKKRPADDIPNATAPPKKSKLSSKQRRKAKRQQEMQEMQEMQDMQDGAERGKQHLTLNPDVVCEQQDKPITSLSHILTRVYHDVSIGSGDMIRVAIPFNNASYRTTARVVDFFPRRLEDFARFRRRNEFDCLSDNEDDGIESSGEEADGTLDSYAGPGTWEWQFDLELEDDSPQTGANRERMWVHVGNAEAQLLTGLDAADLRQNTQDLANLRYMLGKLWGTLEKFKIEEARMKALARIQPPPSSPEAMGEETKMPKVTGNLTFECCIRQFGVEVDVDEDEEDEANASRGKKWKRMYGLFGTKLAKI